MEKFDKFSKVTDIMLILAVMLLAVVSSAALWVWLLDRPWSTILSGLSGILIGVITSIGIEHTLNKYKEI